MARIYISSTYEDLKDYRDAVYRALNRLVGHKVIAMEDYVAADQRPVDKCLQDVDTCDVYVGIFAWRYGFIPKENNPDKKSVTELEFRRAKANGKVCLVFVLDPEAGWKRKFMDEVTGENEAARIAALRTELLDTHLTGKFSDAQQLAGLASTAVANWEKTQAPAGAPAATPAARADTDANLHELRNSLYVAFSPIDNDLARELALLLGARVERPLLLSADALFAQDEGGFEALENGVTRCHAGLVLVTPGSLAQLKAHIPHVKAVLGVLDARLGAVAALLAGVSGDELPGEWRFDAVFELKAPPAAGGIATDVALANVQQWIDSNMPRWGVRTVGVPISVIAMTSAELAQLNGTPNFIENRLGGMVQQQYLQLKNRLAGGAIAWSARYGGTRNAWRPFDPAGKAVLEIAADVVKVLNARDLPKLRHRQVKLQWYPFDSVLTSDPVLRRIYQAVTKTGCVVLVDEVSLFHPDLREAFQNSPFFNNDQVAIVTVSPFDPDRDPLNQLLDTTRQKLAGAFTRYTDDYDPQCELAVGDERRLKRWLHANLPETMSRLQQPQPNRDAMGAFFGTELGGVNPRPKGDYPWGGGGQP